MAFIIIVSNIPKSAPQLMETEKVSPKMEVQIDNRQGNHNISRKKIQQMVQVILNALDFPDGEISILLVDDTQIAAFNQQYLNRRGATNVIAFAMREGEFSYLTPHLLGDVVISMDTTVLEAQEAGISTEQRFKELLIHGILHLFGYDHEQSEEEAHRMDAKSRELLERLEMINDN
jgi:probable rRNA maturation factor